MAEGMIYIPMRYRVDLDRTINTTPLNTLFAMGDNQAHRFELTITHGSVAEDLTGCEVKGKFVSFSNNMTVILTGSVENGNAIVALKQPCYTQLGRFALVIQIVKDGMKTSVFYGDGYMRNTSTDNAIIDEDYIVYDTDVLLSKIQEIENAISGANAAISNANAAAEHVDANMDAKITARVDKTLSVENGIADAKTVGEEIGSLKHDLTYISNGKTDFYPSLINNKYVDYSDGNIVSFETNVFSCTDFIRLPLEIYTLEHNFNCLALGGWAFYKSDKTFISGGQSSKISEIPSDAVYFAICDSDSTMSHENLKITFYCGEAYKNQNIKNEETDEKIATTELKLKDFVQTDNLFNRNEVIRGYLDAYDGSIKESPTGINGISNWIKVYSGDVLHIAKWKNSNDIKFVRVNEYSEKDTRTFIKYTDINSNEYTVENDGYVLFYTEYNKLYGSDDNPTEVTVSKKVLSEYVEYGYAYNGSVKYANESKTSESADKLNTWYKDKICDFMGDSITEQWLWQLYVKNALQFKQIINHGIGGTHVSGLSDWGGVFDNSFWQDVRVNALSENADVIVIMGGTNDCASSRIIGDADITNHSPINFIGAYNLLLSKIFYKYYALENGKYDDIDYSTVNKLTSFKDIKVFLMTPTYNNNETYSGVESSRLATFADATKEVGKLWGLPVIDNYYNAGINSQNTNVFLSDTVHPNDDGAKKLASVAIGTMKLYEPVR